MITPKLIAKIGGTLILISGIVNLILGIQIDALIYEVYPGGNMGHVGIWAGIAAIIIGIIILFSIIPLYESPHRNSVLRGGVLTIILGHIGGIGGAIYVGTAGVAFCYIAGIWILITTLK